MQQTVADTGISGLFRIANSGKTTPEIIQNYTHIVYKNRLEILYGYKDSKDEQETSKFSINTYKEIIQNANKFYDIVLVDLDKGLNNEIVKPILNTSDVIVYNIEQKLDMINDFKELKENSDITKKNNIVLNIGRLDEESKYTVKNIARYLGIRKDVTMIPYNTLFFEAASEEKVSEFFLKIRKLNETDKNAIFWKQVKETVGKIIYKLQEVQMKI